jgi:hypothetical protein
MNPFAKADSPVLPTRGGSDEPPRGSRGKHSGNEARRGARLASSSSKIPHRKTKRTNRSSSIRETEEARALLEDQLSSPYWWVFNGFKMNGFIRVKGLDELQHPTAAGDESHTEQGDLADDHVFAGSANVLTRSGQIP